LIRITSGLEFLLLFVNVSDLKVDIMLGQGFRRVRENISTQFSDGKLPKTLQRRIVLLMLLVNNPQPKVDLIRLFKVWIHSNDRGEGFLGMLKASVPVVQDSNPIPELWILNKHVRNIPTYLWIWQMIQCLLIRIISLLKLIHHQIAMSDRSPHLAIRALDIKNPLEEFNRFRVLLLYPADPGY
jgi:hypothetical protein